MIFRKQSDLGTPRAGSSGRKLEYLKELVAAAPVAFPVRKSVHVRGFCPERIKRQKRAPAEYLHSGPPKSVHDRGSGLTLPENGTAHFEKRRRG